MPIPATKSYEVDKVDTKERLFSVILRSVT
jgi:hypothetical protein